MSQPLSDDDTISKSTKNTPAPLKRALSFPFDIPFNQIEELANEVLQNHKEEQENSLSTQSSIPSLQPQSPSFPSQICESQSLEEISLQDNTKVARKRKFKEISSLEIDNAQQPPRKKRRILTRARAAKYTHLSDLIKCGILQVGESISIKGQTGIVNRDGWIEYGDTTYPGTWTWCNAIKKQNTDVSLSIPINDSLNTQSEEQLGWNNTFVQSKNAPLDKFKDLFEKEEEFRRKIQSHRLKLLAQKRQYQGRREKQNKGIPQSQIEELSDLLPPSPIQRSNLDGHLYDESLNESLDEDMEDSYEEIQKTKPKRKKKSSSPKKTKNPQPKRDFSKWTPIVTSDERVISSKNDNETNNSTNNNQKTTRRIVQVEKPITIPDSDDFFSIPESEPPIENESSLNSLVQNLIHLQEGTEPQESYLEDIEMEENNNNDDDDILITDSRNSKNQNLPNRLIPDDDDDEISTFPKQKKSQEWIPRRNSPASSPSKRSNQSNVSSSPPSSPLEQTPLSPTQILPSPSPQKTPTQKLPTTPKSLVYSVPESLEEVLLPDSHVESIPNETNSEKTQILPESSKNQSESNDEIMDEYDRVMKDVHDDDDENIIPLTDSESNHDSDSSAIRCYSAPESESTELQYKEHEVFIIPSQPAPLDHQTKEQQENLQQPITKLSEKWNKRKQYQRQLEQKKTKNRNNNIQIQSSPANQTINLLSQNEIGENEFHNMNQGEDPVTSQTIPCESQGSQPLSSSNSFMDSPPQEVAPLKTLAEQWEERKRSNSSDSIKEEPENLLNYTNSPSHPISIDDELKKLESLEQDQSRILAEKKQIEQSERLQAVLLEQEKLQIQQEKQRQMEIEQQKIKEIEIRRKQQKIALEEQRKLELQEKQRKQKELQAILEKQKIEAEELAKQRKQQEMDEQRRIQEEKQRIQIQEDKNRREALELREKIKKQAEMVALQEKQRKQQEMEEQRRIQEERQRIYEEKQRKQKRLKEMEEQKRIQEEKKRKQAAKAEEKRKEKEQQAIMEQKRKEMEEKRRKVDEFELNRLEEEEKKIHEKEQKRKTRKTLSKDEDSFISSQIPIENIVSLCHDKQRILEENSSQNSLGGGSSNSSIDLPASLSSEILSKQTQLKKTQMEEKQIHEQQRKQQELQLSQRIDEIISSSCSSLSSVGGNESKSSLSNLSQEEISSHISTYHAQPQTSSPSIIQKTENVENEEMYDNASDGDNDEIMNDYPDISSERNPIGQSTTTYSPTTSPIILASGLSSVMLQRIHMLVQELGGELVSQFSEKVTHLVVLPEDKCDKITRRTLKYTQAILSGIWIVNYDWILQSFYAKQWIDECKYQIFGDNICSEKTPQKARKAKNKHKKRLFSGLKFYFCGDFEAVDVKVLRKVVSTGHGKVYSELPRAPRTSKEEIENINLMDKWIILCDGTAFDYDAAKDVYFASGFIPLSYEYLFDCVSHFELLPQTRYRILETQSQQFQSQFSQAF